jgi:hypothetical protein
MPYVTDSARKPSSHRGSWAVVAFEWLLAEDTVRTSCGGLIVLVVATTTQDNIRGFPREPGIS